MELHFPMIEDSRATSNTVAVDPQLDSSCHLVSRLVIRERQHFAVIRTVA